MDLTALNDLSFKETYKSRLTAINTKYEMLCIEFKDFIINCRTVDTVWAKYLDKFVPNLYFGYSKLQSSLSTETILSKDELESLRNQLVEIRDLSDGFYKIYQHNDNSSEESLVQEGFSGKVAVRFADTILMRKPLGSLFYVIRATAVDIEILLEYLIDFLEDTKETDNL